MAAIYFVRHGQASFGSVNYDALSELGHEQAFTVGKYLAKACQADAGFHGSLTRQQQTFNEINKSFSDLKSVELMGLNEFDHDDVLAAHFPEFHDRDKFAALLAKQDDPKKYFHKMYQQSVRQWLANDGDYKETFEQFSKRVKVAFQTIQQQIPESGTAIAVSSAGPIALCLQDALGLSVEKVFALNEVMANSAVTRVIFNRKGKVSLSFYNNYQHLVMSDTQVTYR